MASTSSGSKPRKPRRIPVTKPNARPGFVERTSRPLYTSRKRRGPLLAPSEKSEGLLGCESVLESKFVAATRFDDRVERAYAQSRVMDVVSGLTAPDHEKLMERLASEGYAASEAKLWYIDFELILVGTFRPVYVEVKPESRAAAVEADLEARRAACERIGVGFLLVLDKHFPETLAHNLHILQRYVGTPVSEETKSRILQALSGGAHTIAELTQLADAGLAEVYGLVANGMLAMDLFEDRLDRQARVRPSAGEPRKILPLA